MNVSIQTVDHEDQRYDTVGDWRFADDGSLKITVSQLGDARYNALVAVHELVEALLCQHDGVDQDEVDAFDVAFEAARQEGNVDEPGMDPRAPYHFQHRIADGIERLLAVELEVDWSHYERAVNSL